MIVVLDSSTWISALVFGGTPSRALIRAQTVDSIVICNEIEEEVVRIVGRKFAQTRSIVLERMAELSKGCIRVPVTGKVSGVCRDPKDDFILECASTGNADAVVTGDKDLLSMVSYGNIEIVTARQYLDRAKMRKTEPLE